MGIIYHKGVPYASGTINEETPYGTSAPSGGSDGDLYVQIDNNGNIVKVWQNHNNTWGYLSGGETYTAGTNISIDNNVISAIDTNEVSGLNDVEITNLDDGQVLKWDGTNEKWVNDDEAGGLTPVEMDYEDWLELPQEERENPNIEYFLSNAPSGGGGLNVTVTKILDQHIETTGEFALDSSIDNYDALLIGGYNYVSSSYSNQYKTTLILKEDYYKNTSNHADHILGNMTASTSGDNPRRVIFYFPDDTHINIQTRNYASIDKIFGLKFEQCGGGGSSEVNYSTEEQVIGTWIDGKPLYQKTYQFNGSLGRTYTVLDADLTKDEVRCTASSFIISGSSIIFSTNILNNSSCTIGYNPSVGLYLENYSSYTITKATVTIEYTKTTD